MLVLSRKKDEKIVLTGGIEVSIVQIRGDKVRLGIVAPKEIAVHRSEVWDLVQREMRERKERKDAVLPSDI